jgi:hypothetical protein
LRSGSPDGVREQRLALLRSLIVEAEECLPVMPMLEMIERLAEFMPRNVLATWALADAYLDE